MADFAVLQALTPWRITVHFDIAFGAQADVTRYTLRRGGTSLHPIASAWTRGTAVVELALDDALIPDAVYELQHTDAPSTARVAYHAPVTSPAQPTRALLEADMPEDPEGLAFGVDVDWFGPDRTPDGDFPEVRGLASLKHDLAVLSVTNPGELLHRPRAGLGLRSRVNGTTTDGELQEVQADTEAAYLTDDRVRAATVTLRRVESAVYLQTSILTPPLSGDTIDFTTRL